MTPGARLQTSIQLLGLIWRGSAPTDVILNDYFRRRRYAGATDRRVIIKQVYDILRRRAKLEWWILKSEPNIAPSPRLCLLVALAIMECMSLDEIVTLFSGAKYCPETLNNHEKALANSFNGEDLYHPDMPRPITFEYPAWMDHLLFSLWGERFEEEITALNQPAPVDLRVNTLMVTRERAQFILSGSSIAAEPTPLSPVGLRINGHQRLIEMAAFKSGLFEVQDEGSQLLALLVGARPGMTVIDLCAGAGGKTLALAAAMAKNGRLSGNLHACDISPNRISRMHDRIKRARVSGITLRTISVADDAWVRENPGLADRVLADVPCTGSGRWRRDLISKWRYQSIDLESFRLKQRSILSVAASLVKPGGRLIYATCSLLQQENEEQVAWFLKKNKSFTALSMDKVWDETIGGAQPQTGFWLRLSPASTGTDGFFCAVIERHT